MLGPGGQRTESSKAPVWRKMVRMRAFTSALIAALSAGPLTRDAPILFEDVTSEMGIDFVHYSCCD